MAKYKDNQNPIILVLGDPAYQKKRESRAIKVLPTDEMLARALYNHPLDPESDKELPQWAYEVLADYSLSFKARVMIVMLHNYGICGRAPLWGSMKAAQPLQDAMSLRSEPGWLGEFRKKQAEKAEALINKRRKENENGN